MPPYLKSAYEYDSDPDDTSRSAEGPKKQALYEALYEAFPNCNSPSDLGKLIVDKFKELGGIVEP